VADYITRERHNAVYALVVAFAAYTGVRAAGLAGSGCDAVGHNGHRWRYPRNPYSR